MAQNTGKSRKGTQSSDMEDRSFGVGDPNSPLRESGKAKSRWSKVDLSGSGINVISPTTAEVDVPHDLGQVPTMCELRTYTNAVNPGTVITAVESRRENWSHSHCHMAVTILRGVIAGCVGDFMVTGR